MQEALEIEKDVGRRWCELLYPAHLLNISHGELGWAPLQSSTAKHPKPNSWKKKPKAQLCAFGGVCRSHKDRRRHQRAIDTQLLGGFVAAAEEQGQPWTVADLPVVSRVALTGWWEGEGRGTPLSLLLRAVLGPELSHLLIKQLDWLTPDLTVTYKEPNQNSQGFLGGNLSLICMLEQSKDDQWRWFAKILLKPKKQIYIKESSPQLVLTLCSFYLLHQSRLKHLRGGWRKMKY